MLQTLSPAQLEPGDRVGEYLITRVIGNGGFSVVYEAEDLSLERLVAIKQLRPEAFTQAGSREWFMREARLTASLTHPNIVNIYSLREQGDSLFLVMEYLPGDLHELEGEHGPLDRNTLLAVASDICRALETLHARNVIHRDIKPENILFAQPRHFKLADFGLAHIHPTQRYGTHDATGPQPGTLLYMAPEQALGHQVTPRSDIYALAAVLYEAATGHNYLDFDDATGDDEQLIDQIVNGNPRPCEDLHPTVSTAIEEPLHRALSKFPQDRPATAREFLNEFRRALGGKRPSLARRQTRARRDKTRSMSDSLRQELANVRTLRENGQNELAASRLKPLLKKHRTIPEVLAEWGETLLALGRIDDAHDVLQAVVQQKATLPFAQLALAEIFANWDDHRAATEATIAAIHADPDLVYAALYDFIVESLGDPPSYNSYVGLFRRAVLERPTASRLHNLGLVLSLNPNHEAECITAFEAAIRRDPTYGPAYVGLGTLMIETGNIERGIELLERATQADFPILAAQDQIKLQTVYQPQHAFLALSVAYAQHGEYESSAIAARAVLDIDPTELSADAPGLLDVYLQTAHRWLENGQTLRAYKFLNQIIPVAAYWGETRVFALLETTQRVVEPVHLRQRQWDDAIDWLRSGIMYWRFRAPTPH